VLGAEPTEHDAVDFLRAAAREGDHARALAFAAGLGPSLREGASVALQVSRAHLRQGFPRRALAALDGAALDRATAGEALLMQVERSFVGVMADGRLGRAIEAAQQAIAASNVREGPYLAEARAIEARVLLVAVTYYEAPAQRAAEAIEALKRAGATLEETHRIDEALAAYQTAADRAPPAERARELNSLCSQALRLGRPSMAGEARLAQAYAWNASGASDASVHESLEEAKRHFAEARHVLGPIDVRAAKARFRPVGDQVAYGELEACLHEYRRAGYAKGAISILLDISQRAHARGLVSAAVSTRNELLALLGETGLALTADTIQLAVVDLLMRATQYRAAIEACRDGISGSRPAFIVASYRQLLASVYGNVGDHKNAIEESRMALAGFEGIGALDSASVVAGALANRLYARRTDPDWDEGLEILSTWAARDDARADDHAAATKRELIAQGLVQIFHFSPSRGGRPDVLAAAAGAVEAATVAVRKLPPSSSAQRIGNLGQLRSQLAQARRDTDGAEKALTEAIDAYEAGGYLLEAANTSFMLGCFALNRANVDPERYGNEAQARLFNALRYYESAGMRDWAADAHFMLAQLYANTSVLLEGEARAQIAERALGHIAEAERSYDTIRRAYSARSTLEARIGKQTFVEKSARIYDLALQILLRQAAPALEIWRWAQRGKARSLGDALGAAAAPTPDLLAGLEADPATRSLLERERSISEKVRGAAPSEWSLLEADLRTIHASMAQQPALRRYLDLRVGAAVDGEELGRLLFAAAGDTRTACVDWFAVRGQIYISVFRSPGDVVVERTPLSVEQVRAWLGAHFNPNTFRPTLREDEPSLLRELDALVEPLGRLSAEEDLLVLSPTAPLHALPLHALHVRGAPLILRNPVAYTPNLGSLRACFARGEGRTRFRSVALFGDSATNLSDAGELVATLGLRFSVKPALRDDVTRRAIENALTTCDLFHFQGHAVFEALDPLRSHLVLSPADENLEVRSLFDRPPVTCRLVTLAACESAVNQVKAGDDPMGLVPGFLYAGAAAVLATLWKVSEKATSVAIECFYDAVTGPNPICKAHALRSAMLAVRSHPKFERPYFWAGFTLHGDFR
jgi:tetratricopeptide (TPR) repeat protein